MTLVKRPPYTTESTEMKLHNNFAHASTMPKVMRIYMWRMMLCMLSILTTITLDRGEADANTEKTVVDILALGDSYTANPGALEPYRDLNTNCYRSRNSYVDWFSQQLESTGIPTTTTMKACTGGVTADIYDQLDQLSSTQKKDMDLIFLTTGGNDVYFAAIAGFCLAPKSAPVSTVEKLLDELFPKWRLLSNVAEIGTSVGCSRLITDAGHNIQNVVDDLDGVLSRIKLEMPQARVVMLGYPNLVSSDNCANAQVGSYNLGKEMRIVQGRFDLALSELLSQRNSQNPDGYRFVPMSGIYSEHTVCGEGDLWLRTTLDTANYIQWYHPNIEGNQATARYLFSLGVHNNLPLSTTSAYSGKIVKWTGDNTTAWLVDSNGYRRWIETGAIYNCLVSNGADVVVLNTGQLDALPDLNGQTASCVSNQQTSTAPPPSYDVPLNTLPLQCGITVPYASTYDSYAGFQHGQAIDLPVPAGTKVVAPVGGRATVLSDPSGYGNYIDLAGADGLTHRFAHLQATGLIASGSIVNQGQVIGLVGTTGASTGPHLHYEQRNANGQTTVHIDGISLVWGPRLTAGGDRYTTHSLTSNNCGVGVSNVPTLLGIKTSNSSSGSVEMHNVSLNNPLGFSLQSSTALQEINLTEFDFSYADYNGDGVDDLWAIKKYNTTTNQTVVHIIDGKDPQKFLLHKSTALHATNDNWEFEVADYNGDGVPDLWGIKGGRTSSGKTEVHIISGKDPSKFLLQTATGLGQSGDDWTFELGDYNRDGKIDLWAIRTHNTGSNSTEVHIMNGKDLRKFLLHSGTALHEAPNNNFQFAIADSNGDGRLDIWAIKQSGTTSGKTEIHIIDGSNLSSFIAHHKLGLHATNNTWVFEAH